MAGQERPVRRTVVFACTVLLVVVCGVAAGFFGFLGVVVHPVFFWWAAFVSAGGVGIGWWMWRDLHRTDKQMERIEDTVLLLDLEEGITRYRPPAPGRRRDPRRLLRYIRHAGGRIREGSQR